MKKVIFLRHGEADWPNWEGSDDERPLTKKGKAEVNRVAKFLKHAGARPLLIFTSPLPRAAQTAKIVAKRLCLELGVNEELGKGFNIAKLRRILREHDVETLIVVGHEPDFTHVLRLLTGGEVRLAKAGVALVEMESAESKGRLLWLFPPRFARKR